MRFKPTTQPWSAVKRVFEKWLAGSTGDPPVPSSDSPERESPAPPIFKTGSTNRTVGLATPGSPSPLPSPSGRGRTVLRLSITIVADFARQLLAEHPVKTRCSPSLRERVRVRGKHSVASAECSLSQRLGKRARAAFTLAEVLAALAFMAIVIPVAV